MEGRRTPDPEPPGDAQDPGQDTGEPGGVDHEVPTGEDPLRFDRWRRRSATGAVMTGIAFGLQQALVEPKQEPAIVVEAAGEPEDPDADIVLRFDPDDPSKTVAVVRDPDRRDPPAGSSGA